MGTRLPAAERREAILRASIALFARRGFEGTSTRDLARESGVSEALVFRHFPDKGALYRAILERKMRDMEAILPLRALARSEEPPERLLAGLARLMVERIDADPSFLRLYLYSALAGHPLARAFERHRAAALRRVLAGYLRRRGRRGGLREGDARFAARAFLSTVVWLCVARGILGDPETRRVPAARLGKQVAHLFLDGVRGRR